MSQFLCTAVNASIDESEAAQELTRGAIDRMQEQLNADDSVDVDFSTFHTEYEVDVNPGNVVNDEEFIRKSVKRLWEQDNVCDGDSWLIVDASWTHGYGMGRVPCEPEDGMNVFGARAFYMPGFSLTPEPVEAFQNLVIHEMLHNFTVRHRDGNYQNSRNLLGVTPVATCYAYGETSKVDTRWAGTGTIPDEFCSGTTNHQDEEWCGSCEQPCRWSDSITKCSRQQVDHKSPL